MNARKGDGEPLHVPTMRPDDADRIPELLPILAALERGTVAKKIALLQIVCPKQHHAAWVFRTSAGPVVYGQGPTYDVVMKPGVTVGQFVPNRRALPVAARIDDLKDDAGFLVQCDCAMLRATGAWLREQLANPKTKRVLLRPHMP